MTTSDFDALKVLVVDDDSYQRLVIGKMLSAIGVPTVHFAESAQRALVMMGTTDIRVDALICDLDMPEMDGMEFLRRVAEQGFECSVIILSGKDANILRSVELMAKEYRLAVLGSLEKPATIGTLRTLLQQHWARPKARERGTQPALSVDAIRAGLEAGQFEPFFQPKVSLQTGQVCGAEALARWRHPERGILPPVAFIGPIEESGQMDGLTWMMLDRSAAWCRRWCDDGLDIPVSVNLSLSSLHDTRLSNRLLDIVNAHRIKPANLLLEVTETTAMTDVARCLETFSRLRMKGFGLSIDDFGTGFSSLQQLSRIPFTELKIDQSFVADASAQPSLRAVIESSVQLAKNLGLKTVGEGVETRDDWLCLKQAGCEIAQGYFIAKPMEGGLLLPWVKEWQSKSSV
ncbi:MAG: EAL domain-containing response regulator [Burkholderiales bacterium]|nr:EAL domain-containing response regulator [Burkholderiales bacterium]